MTQDSSPATAASTAVDSGNQSLPSESNGTVQNGGESPPDEASPAPTGSRRSKYRHVAAYHSEIRHSCLTRDSNITTSFLGFRNLMVIVLGEIIPFSANARSTMRSMV